MLLMSIQNRISVTLSPRIKKALELAAAIDGSTAATYASHLLSSTIKQELKNDPILFEKWVNLEREALNSSSWDEAIIPEMVGPSGLLGAYSGQTGWFLSGDNPDEYVIGKLTSTHNSSGIGYIKSKHKQAKGFATIMQQVKAGNYTGHKLGISASIKTMEVQGWVGFWARLDDEDAKCLWFDNMQDRPIKGTTEWNEYRLQFDVPNNCTLLNFGVLLAGPGEAQVSNITFVIRDSKKIQHVTELNELAAF